MDAAHLHLLLNHVPVLGTLFGLLLMAYGLVRRQENVVKISLGVFVISGLAAGAAYLSGEEAEEILEKAAGVSEVLVETHADAAFYALIAAVVLGVFSLGGLVLFRRKLPGALAVSVLILALAAGGIMAWTANLGGQIRHPEIRKGGVTQYLETPARPDPDDD